MDIPPLLSGKLILAFYAAPLLVGGLYDLWRYRIPNWLTGLLLLFFLAAAALSSQPVDWLSHAMAGISVLAVGAGLFAMRLIGGGDVKLLAVVALWLGSSQLLPFVIFVSLIGGAFALLVLMLRSPAAAMVLHHNFLRLGVLQTGAPLPYGVAIAAAGLWLTPRLPLL